MQINEKSLCRTFSLPENHISLHRNFDRSFYLVNHDNFPREFVVCSEYGTNDMLTS